MTESTHNDIQLQLLLGLHETTAIAMTKYQEVLPDCLKYILSQVVVLTAQAIRYNAMT